MILSEIETPLRVWLSSSYKPSIISGALVIVGA